MYVVVVVLVFSENSSILEIYIFLRVNTLIRTGNVKISGYANKTENNLLKICVRPVWYNSYFCLYHSF